jgi:hypothetical protein
MSAAVITASASVLVAVLVFVLNQRGQLRLERRKARLSRINSQLRELYGPLNVLVDTNETIWRTLRSTAIPAQDERRAGAMTDAEREAWRRWVAEALMPLNRTMKDLIISHGDLLVEEEMPEPLKSLCAHVLAHEVLLADNSGGDGAARGALIRHPGDTYVTYVRETFAKLKAEQLRLLGLTTRGS